MLRRAAAILPPAGVVISYGASSALWAPRGLQLVDRLEVDVSWQGREEIRIFKRRI